MSNITHFASFSGQYGENHPKALTASADWAALLFNKGEMTEAEKLYRKVLPPMRIDQQRRNIEAAFLMDAVTNFGYLRRTQGDSKEAEAGPIGYNKGTFTAATGLGTAVAPRDHNDVLGDLGRRKCRRVMARKIHINILTSSSLASKG
jgi:hypothetical protein